MENYMWLTVAEAASYLRTSESVVRAKMEIGEIPYSEFGGQPLFHRSQLDEYLFSLQDGRAKSTGGEIKLAEGPALPGDFMAYACRLWDDGQAFTVKAGEKGASLQFKGRPRLWVFPDKFQVPAREKGNEIYSEIREVLAGYFPHIISRATVRAVPPSFSWTKFVEFIGQIKDICHKKGQEVTTAAQSHGPKNQTERSLYNRCIELWEDPPEFTIVPGGRGCSARHNDRPRLWFFADYVRIPAEGQGNEMFESIREAKEVLFPNAKTATRIDFSAPAFDENRLYTLIADVKKLCASKDKR